MKLKKNYFKFRIDHALSKSTIDRNNGIKINVL